ncbi:hypothetical protein HQ560_02605 [bacterium]|nr:hypothetical protein [bacterium]
MRVETRLLLLKAGAAVAILAVIFLLMHALLPGVASRREPADPCWAAARRIDVVGQRFDPLLPALFHQTVHVLMGHGDGSAAWSPWLAEGLGAFFGNTIITQGRFRLGGVSRRDAGHIVALSTSGQHVPLAALVRTSEEAFASDRGALHAREAGMLVAFLLWGTDGGRREGFFRYCQLERQPGPTPADAFETHMRTPLDGLETEWLAYLQQLAR